MHLRCDQRGNLLTFVLTPGQVNEAPLFPTLLTTGAIRQRCGRPKCLPKRVIGDKSYSSRAIRLFLRRRGVRVTIPRRSTETRTGRFDRKVYRLRNGIERLINRMKQFRRIATRYEKGAENYRTMWIIAAVVLSLQFADTP